MELNDAKEKNPSIEPGWELTSLKPFVDLFEAHVKGLLQETKGTTAPVKRQMGQLGLFLRASAFVVG